MDSPPGYPLPDGELGEDEIVCQLVYLPDRPEYWQAFLGAYHYLTTWRAWERDDDKRGKDAASNWRAAFELTIGCWRMTCLQDLQDDVAAILAIMQLGNSCCDEQDVTGGDRYTDRVTDGEGDVPQNIIDAGYADDAADWDGFDDYKCMIVHVTVNQMEARLNELAPLVSIGGALFGGLAAVAAIITVIFSGGSAAIIFGLAASVGVVSALYDAIFEEALMELLADKVATNHEELACTMYNADGDVGALVALNDKIDELFSVPEALILKNLNNGPTLKALYAGRYDQQDIAAELEAAGYDLEDFDCACEFPVGEFYLTYEFDSDADNWEVIWPGQFRSIEGNPQGSLRGYHTGGDRAYFRKSAGQIGTDIGKTSETGDRITIHRISLDAFQQTGAVGDLELVIAHDNTTTTKIMTPGDSWVNYRWDFDPPLINEEDRDTYPMVLRVINGSGMWHYFDNLIIDFDADMD